VAEGTDTTTEPASPETATAAGHAAEGVIEGVGGGVRVPDDEMVVEPVSDDVGDAIAPNDSDAVAEADAVMDAVSDAVGVTEDVPVRVGVRDSV